MGMSSSKHTETGVLQGAYAPPIPGVTVPSPPEGGKDYEVIIPSDKKAGEPLFMTLAMDTWPRSRFQKTKRVEAK